MTDKNSTQLKLGLFYTTREDVNDLKSDLKDLYQKAFNLSADANTQIMAILRKHPFLQKELGIDKLTLNDIDKLRSQLSVSVLKLQEIEDYLASTSTVQITLAIHPSPTLLSKLKATLNDVLRSDFVLDVKVDRRVVGGLIINYKGHYVDLSLNRILSEKLAPLTT